MRTEFRVEAVPNAARMRRVVTRTAFAITKEAVQQQQSAFQARIVPPATVHYPIVWTSEKQRRAYYASDGFGGGIPYKRTGALQRNSQLIAAQTSDGGLVILQLPFPFQYAYGTTKEPYQQAMHRGSGYPSGIGLEDEMFSAVRQTLQSLFVETLLAFGFLKTGD